MSKQINWSLYIVRKVFKSEGGGGKQSYGGRNLTPTPVEIGLTEPPNSGWAKAPPDHPLNHCYQRIDLPIFWY